MDRNFAPLDTQRLRFDQFERISRQGMLLAIAMHAVFGLFGLLWGAPLLAYLQIASIAIYIATYSLSFRRHQHIINGLTLLDLLGHSALAAWIVGPESGFQYYSWILLPLTFTHLEFSQRSRLWRAVILCTAFIVIDAWLRTTTPLVAVSESGIMAMRYFNIACFFTATTLAALAYTRATANAEAKLRRAADTDALTGLLNRRRMADRMRQVWDRARQEGRPMAVMLLDIDQFKSINDRFGHACGDDVIVTVGEVLKRTVRRGDLVARWGGEEFLVLLPDTALAEAREISERMRLEISQARFADTGLCVSATIGLATWHESETLDATIHRADTLLYRGKRIGRDRVVVEGSDDHHAKQPIAS
jgi:diguanylate cyclase (GGDEF)-like protein